MDTIGSHLADAMEMGYFVDYRKGISLYIFSKHSLVPFKRYNVHVPCSIADTCMYPVAVHVHIQLLFPLLLQLASRRRRKR